MPPTTDDVRIREIKELAPPSHCCASLPCSERASKVTYESRQAIHRILHGMDDRLLVVVGPCSIHDTAGGDGVCAAPARSSATAFRPTSRS
jgi:3-deoxy-7-phosphoheptulonate synthase